MSVYVCVMMVKESNRRLVIHSHTYPRDAALAANASSVHLLCRLYVCFAILNGTPRQRR